MKKIIIIFLIIIFIICGIFWPTNNKLLKGKINIEISIKDYGKMKLKLDADNAPITVTNFVNLVNNKFYDGLTIHRVISGFMIQGGAPKNNNEVKTIKGEFTSNGYNNKIKHERGVISMARSDDVNSASTQFFIMQEAATHLDGNYAAFGRVTKGIEVVDKIVEDVSSLGDDNGVLPKDKEVIIEYIKVLK